MEYLMLMTVLVLQKCPQLKEASTDKAKYHVYTIGPRQNSLSKAFNDPHH